MRAIVDDIGGAAERPGAERRRPEIRSAHRVDRWLREADTGFVLCALGMDPFHVLREWAPGEGLHAHVPLPPNQNKKEESLV